ncbi:MAG: penicillin-binding protein [Chloroflexi bacterium]|nr:penicillin-binding protein [Chloroflexota bacterium]
MVLLRLLAILVLGSLGLFVGTIGLMGGTAYTVYASFAESLPPAAEIRKRSLDSFETTRLYDRTGQHLLYEIIPPDGGRRTWVSLDTLPQYLIDATIVMEDKNFYDETLYTNFYGVNVEGVGRAVYGELTGANLGGGSSIPQQVVKNVLFDTMEERTDRSYIRKIKEMVLTIELMRQNPGREGRDEILEAYLNNIFYGNMAYGIEAAAQSYFGKSASELTMAEAAMLVPLPQYPALTPLSQPEVAKERQEMVLDRLYLAGYVTAEEAFLAKQEQLTIAPATIDMQTPHWVLYVRDVLERRYGSDAVYGGGLQVITSIDLNIQSTIEQMAREHVAKVGPANRFSNAAVVVLDVKNAEILAMLGSLDYDNADIDGEINMAVAPLQPGSSFKPFVYATALAQGYTPATMIMDIPVRYPNPPHPDYVPDNYSNTFSGPQSIRTALGNSYNIPAVEMMNMVGVTNVVETARAMGIDTLEEGTGYGLATALGASEVTVLDMAYAFSVFANGGTMLGTPKPIAEMRPGFRQLDPVSILQVNNAQGEELYRYLEPERREVLSPQVAFLMSDILSDNKARTRVFGANSPLTLPDRPVAAKTGTTNDWHDGWTVGYTPQYSVAIWTGNTDHTAMARKADGVRTAAPLWHRIMAYLHEGKPVERFVRPEGIVTARVDAVSGKLPTEYTPSTREELFIAGTVPTEKDDLHVPFEVDVTTGMLATPDCPPEAVQTVVYTVYPGKGGDWARKAGIPQPPEQLCDVHAPTSSPEDIAIVRPRAFQTVGGVVTITGNARAGAQERWWLQVGQGGEPTQWTPITPEIGDHIDNGVLGTWDTTGLDGRWVIQLVVIDGGNPRTVSVPVDVDNQGPSVAITAPGNGQTYSISAGDKITVKVDAKDNIAIRRVELYLNGYHVATNTLAPYDLTVGLDALPGEIENPDALMAAVGPWAPPAPPEGGRALVAHAVAYDAANNLAFSGPVTIYVAP